MSGPWLSYLRVRRVTADAPPLPYAPLKQTLDPHTMMNEVRIALSAVIRPLFDHPLTEEASLSSSLTRGSR